MGIAALGWCHALGWCQVYGDTLRAHRPREPCPGPGQYRRPDQLGHGGAFTAVRRLMLELVSSAVTTLTGAWTVDRIAMALKPS